MILPGATLGLLGGGQLGRLFVLAAHESGYRVIVLDPDADSPAARAADGHLRARYDDAEALGRLAAECAAVTTEFENVPAESLRMLAQHVPVHPAAEAVATTQDRLREKRFLQAMGLATAPFAAVRGPQDLAAAAAAVRFPAILKRASFGYDGKGQIRLDAPEGLADAFDALGGVECVLEQRVELACEVSVVLARAGDGEIASYPLAENEHRDGILAISSVPARIDDGLAAQAIEMAGRIAGGLDYRGVLAVEFFVTRDGRLLVNEIAPRPHNSGHYTVDACVCSQFEQQLRALCGLPLGDTRLLSPVAMVNLLGDRWLRPDGPRWQSLYAMHGARLHLYGKREARPGRKMGHLCVLAATRQAALDAALQLDAALSPATDDAG
ncbi:5-(carboxyamino)imidazole ribonucleotide synthase [Acidihalobacter prosperus]|uniref:N5-carboxyaminoimidazole ribonucleotide synthase n=1 Tax=Acidihalobacter prosperus TaxID=160660 RepID=A0A1A6C0L0_9GAMM|nr:5-(carboxyamino)imidazole ribonucleotide synthase [Acidihalobacter prosperus]OBS08102.1 5-(carboxyamino)imidazole ribonucleotide synthase [Acidihalobacter prosperus]